MDNGDRVELKEFILKVLEEKEKAYTAAGQALEIRLHNLNEWKDQTLVERQNYMTRDEYTSKHESLREKVEALNGQMKVYIALSGIFGAILGILIKHFIG